MKRVIISGATGSIGSALVNELTAHNIEVLVLLRPGTNRKKNILNSPLVEFLECGMDQYSKMENTTGKIYDVFYHFAWGGTTGLERDNMYLQNKNVEYSLDAVGMAKRFGCQKFIGAGSQAEYGRVEGILKPNTPAFPEIGYGYSKLCAGYMTRDYAHQLGLSHVWTRILSVYGPNDGMQSMVMSTICKLLNEETPQLTKGEQMWDYLYSGDAAKAFYLLGLNAVDGKTYVIGSGQVRPLSEYVNIIREEINPLLDINFGAVPYSSKQVMHLQADIKDLQKDLDWTPIVGFNEGIKNILKALKQEKF